jgi:hypothetical protein
LFTLSLLQQAQIQEAESAGSSSQTSTGKVSWDNPYVRGINIAKEQPPLKRPHLGLVTGAGAGRKHSTYGLAEPSTKESRQAKKSQDTSETEALKRKITDLETNMERRVKEQTVAKFNKIMPDLAQRIAAYIAGGQMGPLPLLSLGASNSDKEVSRAQSEPQHDSHAATVTPEGCNTGAGRTEDSPAVAASSLSITCMPAGPSTLAELNTLTVIN